MQEENSAIKTEKKQMLYRMIYKELKSQILDGTYADGNLLPFERELCEKYGVDRVTVRKALDLLVSDGFIEKRAGRGSIVKMSINNGSNGQNPPRNVFFIMSKNQNDINNNPSAFNSELFYAIEQECRKNSCSLIYGVLDEQNNLGNIINGNHFVGLLFVSLVPKQVLDQCVQMNLPAICLNNRHENLISIVPEDEKGSYEAVKYLQSQGHRKIGIVLGRGDYYSTKERFRGFSSAMRDAGLPIDPRLLLEGEWTFDGARAAVFKMFDSVPQGELPTAIFCCSDMMAIGVMDALKERDLSIPKNISVMGFDNIRQSNFMYPRLSTVSIDVSLMASLALDTVLHNKTQDLRKGYIVTIPAELELRQSVGLI